MKKVILDFTVMDDRLFQKALRLGFDSFVLAGPPQPSSTITVYWPGEPADVLLKRGAGRTETEKVQRLTISSPEDLRRVIDSAKAGFGEVHVSTKDWRIIPLENLIAMKRGLDVSVIAEAHSAEDAELLFGILEKGVDGVRVKARAEDELGLLADLSKAPTELKLIEATVEEVKNVGTGDRACVDTVSMLEYGEGMLVGSMARMFFLLHNESVGSEFTSPRPFRINAGAVHSYILTPDGTTRYLSEVSAGDRILIVNSMGGTRLSSVGRVKIERRPMRQVVARAGETRGSVIVQNAETIRFITHDRKLRAVTDLAPGDRILCHVSIEKGRHFGMVVDETVVER